jgi:3-deoxy-D-manno-octulosonic-acid transferase
MTPTGSERIRALFGDSVQHCYLPYDLPWAAARFLDRVKPRLAVIMETELWPNHIHQCARRGIPVALANARLSERSARGYARFEGLTRPMLGEMSWLAVQTEAEAERFRRLGARPECVSVTGSIKFDLSIDAELLARAAALRHDWQAEARPVWIAASTHAGEDEIVLAPGRLADPGAAPPGTLRRHVRTVPPRGLRHVTSFQRRAGAGRHPGAARRHHG